MTERAATVVVTSLGLRPRYATTTVTCVSHLDCRATSIQIVALQGFTQTTISYVKTERVHGISGWNLRRKLKLVVDSVTAFSYLPIRLMSYLGFLVAIFGLGYALLVTINALGGHPVPGWSSLMAVVLVLGGFQMAMLGVLGIYLWRALDEARRRPRFLVEAATPNLQRGRAAQTSSLGNEI